MMPETVVIDESHKLKNANTKFHQAMRGIKPHFVVGLSGTPIENSIVDLHSQFAIVNPYLLGSLSDITIQKIFLISCLLIIKNDLFFSKRLFF